jgi:methylated-DNA-[protein]-cysteine S-methyltransferase
LEEIRRIPVTETQSICQYKVIDSPVGPIILVASDTALVSVMWGQSESHAGRYKSKIEHPILVNTELQLREYFLGQRTTFDIPLGPKGTEFQKRVWQELSKIPYGQTISYGEQARRLGRPKSARAVGAANGKNPIGIIIPCHRVIGASGSMTGFAGGIEIKRQLLAIEGKRDK